MPGPREEERRKAQFDPQRDEPQAVTSNKTVSSKRVDEDAQPNPDAVENREPSSTRARRPRSGRSGSDSSASRHTRGH